MIDNLPPVAMGLFAVFDPDDGHGVTESVIAIIIVVGVMALLFMSIEVPSWLVGTFTFVGGAWLGGQTMSNAKTKQRKK